MTNRVEPLRHLSDFQDSSRMNNMTTDYFQDYQSYLASGALASPAHTPEYTPPGLPRSRKSTQTLKQRDFSSVSAPLPSSDSPDHQDGNAYGLDPARFTPTIHASLVSEILSLRRELDSKHRFIEGLEDNLKNTQTENEELSNRFRDISKKSKQAEQKYKHLETGTFDAVESLLSERDNFRNNNQELLAKIETLTKKTRKQGEEAEKTQDMWEKEKQVWANERRLLEQRVHVSETRLKKVIEEMSVQQALFEPERAVDVRDDDFAAMRSHRVMGHSRNQSSVSTTKSFAHSIGSVKRPGMSSLASELHSDDDYDTEVEEDDEDDLPLILGKRSSTCSRSSDTKAKKILGLTNTTSEASTEASEQGSNNKPPTESLRTTSSIAGITARLGLQMARVAMRNSDSSRSSSRSTSPASSSRQKEDPTINPTNDPSLNLDKASSASTERAVAEQVYDQSKVPVQFHSKAPIHPPPRPPIEAPISPPDTPHWALTEPELSKPIYQSTSTQTDLPMPSPAIQDLATRRNISVTPVDVLPIPSIAIHPPLSTPTSPCDTIVPSGIASACVQTDITISKPMHDAGVQTEEIRIDCRPIKLPPHLLPSALESLPALAKLDDGSRVQPQIGPKSRAPYHRSTYSKDGHRLPLKPLDLPPPTLFAPAGETEKRQTQRLNDSVDGKQLPWRVNQGTVEGNGDIGELDLKDVFGNMPGLARPSMRTMFQGPFKTVPEDRAISPAQSMMHSEKYSSPSVRTRQSSESSSISTRPSSSKGKCSSIRTGRSGPFYSSHDHGRPGSTGSYSVRIQPPPYPVPSRSSSRPSSQRRSEEMSTSSPRNSHSIRSRRSSRDSTLPPAIGLRKVQSSGTMKSQGHVSTRRRRRAPNLEPIQSMAFDPDAKFLLPGVTTPAQQNFGPQYEEQLDFESPEFERESAVEEEEEEEEESQDNAIADAIAATMVGEWMWKYVRRRRSFGIGERSDTTGVEDSAGSSGVRHKRWVWLSPYEHTVMWSAKQPNSGPAFLGRNGRKLVVKSVLDVKDVTPLHKSAAHESIFDRSILILTPERALKLTASNKQRHYLWLTALSFLAQSGRGPPQVLRVSPIPPDVEGQQPRRQRTLVIKGPLPQPGRKPARTLPRTSNVSEVTLGSATPPRISRLSAVPARRHQRKRSSTNPQFSIAGGRFSPSLPNEVSRTAIGARRTSNTLSYRPPLAAMVTRGGGRMASAAGPDTSNFFEPVGTVSMDAFIDRGQDVGQRQRGDSIAPSSRRGHGDMLEHDPFDEF